MTTATATLTRTRALDRQRDTRPGLARLTMVELRKMTDTRAGFWLLAATAALTVALEVVFVIFAKVDEQNLEQAFVVATMPGMVLLPLVGILLVSSEWSQRTAPITFALVPRRGRVFAAKLLASVVLACAALVICGLVAAAGTAVMAGAKDGSWALSGAILGQTVVSFVTGMITGVAAGALLLNSAAAIVLYFVAPLAWSALGFIPGLEGPARWLDGARSIGPMTEHVYNATEWGRVGTTLALWMVLPLLAGLWRILRAEVR